MYKKLCGCTHTTDLWSVLDEWGPWFVQRSSNTVQYQLWDFSSWTIPDISLKHFPFYAKKCCYYTSLEGPAPLNKLYFVHKCYKDWRSKLMQAKTIPLTFIKFCQKSISWIALKLNSVQPRILWIFTRNITLPYHDITGSLTASCFLGNCDMQTTELWFLWNN